MNRPQAPNSYHQLSDQPYSIMPIILLSVLASIAVSFWSFYADPIINNDGIDYVRAAQALVHWDFVEAKSHYKWLFYPAIIALTHQLLGVSFIVAAAIINALCNILAVYFFILLVRLFGASKSIVILGAVVIVSFPGLNEIRSYIVRDHGYIAFYLASFYFFCKYSLDKSRIDYTLSLAMALIAFLFRIEGLIFSLLIIFLPIRERIKDSKLMRVVAASALIICLFILMGVYGSWLYTPTLDAHYSKLSIQAVFLGWEQLIANLSIRIELLKSEVLQTASDGTGRLVYIWTSIGIVVTHVMSLLTLVYSLFLIYGWRKKLYFPVSALYAPWIIFILANLVILVLFTLTQLFLTDRYPLPLAVMLLIGVVFALNYFITNWLAARNQVSKKGFKIIGYIILLALVVNGVQGLTSKTNKKDIPIAAEQFREIMRPDYSLYKRDNVLFTNSKLFGFYTGINAEKMRVHYHHSQMMNFLYQGKWIDYQYVILDIKLTAELETHLAKAFWPKPTVIFEGRNGHQYRLYDIKQYRADRKAGKVK